jgi:hypothetical protein
MTEVNPPAYEQNGCYTAQQDRQVIEGLICVEGVREPATGSLQVSPGGGLSVNVAAGSGYIQGDNVATQGVYYVVNDGTVNLALAAADPTDGRVDRVIAEVLDSQYSGVSDLWQLRVITGTPSPAPTPPAEPINAITLALVTVGAGAVTPVVTDGRQSYQLCPEALPDTSSNPHLRRTRSSTQLIPNNTATTIIWPDLVEDVPANDPIGYANGVFTANKTGRYVVGAGIHWASNGTGRRELRVLVNGVDIRALDSRPANAQALLGNDVQTVVHLVDGDTVEFQVLQTSGGNLNVESSTARNWATVSFMNA